MKVELNNIDFWIEWLEYELNDPFISSKSRMIISDLLKQLKENEDN